MLRITDHQRMQIYFHQNQIASPPPPRCERAAENPTETLATQAMVVTMFMRNPGAPNEKI